MAETRVPVPGGSLAVHDFGSGPPVVLLHAGIVDSWAWEPLTPFLLDAEYRVVAYDRRGFGDSVTEDVPFSNRADLVAVLDALGIGRAALVGNSIGGMVAIDSAVEFPDRIMALVTLGSGVGGYEAEVPPEEDALFTEMDRLEEAGDPDAYADFCVRLWVDGPGQPADRVPEDIRELVRDMCRELAEPGRVWGQPIPLDPPAAGRLDGLTMPVLAISGSLDVSDVAVSADYLAANAPDARAVVMPGVAHMIGLEAPDDLGALITGFLAPLPRWA